MATTGLFHYFIPLVATHNGYSSILSRMIASRAICLLDGRERLVSFKPYSKSTKDAKREAKRVVLGEASMAHPSKANLWRDIEKSEGEDAFRHYLAKGVGQDAFFASPDGLIVVADGVGSWDDGAKVARLSRLLVNNIAKSYSQFPKEPAKLIKMAVEGIPQDLLQNGSTTVTVGVIDGSTLRIANIGDSGFRVYRPGRGIVYATAEQQHFANCPFQLGGESSDRPESAQSYEFGILPGDVIIAASDGLFDNVHDTEISECIAAKASSTPAEIAKRLLSLTSEFAYPTESTTDSAGKRVSPFAKRYNLDDWSGGKPDDITIVVGVPSDELY